ncbi:hypothetical protein MC885_004654 [Smutsia gigantea]|nr:hypothetical protein MC885_004654 [Smutsia gigantea]
MDAMCQPRRPLAPVSFAAARSSPRRPGGASAPPRGLLRAAAGSGRLAHNSRTRHRQRPCPATGVGRRGAGPRSAAPIGPRGRRCRPGRGVHREACPAGALHSGFQQAAAPAGQPAAHACWPFGCGGGAGTGAVGRTFNGVRPMLRDVWGWERLPLS